MAIKKKLSRVELAILLREMKEFREREVREIVNAQADATIAAGLHSRLEIESRRIRERVMEMYRDNLLNRMIAYLKKKMGR